jgi:hypothetical protein
MKTIVKNPSKRLIDKLESDGIPYTISGDYLTYDQSQRKPKVFRWNADPIEVNFKNPKQ